MYQKKMEQDIRCPLEYGLEIFGGKWKPRIICVLNLRLTIKVALHNVSKNKILYFRHSY